MEAVALAGAADLAAVEDDLQVEAVPAFGWIELFEVVFRLHDILSLSEPPALGKAVYVCIHGKGRHAEGLRHDHGGGFVPYPRKRLQRLHICGDLRSMLLHEDHRKIVNGFGFPWSEPARTDDGFDLFDGEADHGGRCIGQSKERGSGFIDSFVGALSGEKHRNEEGVGIFMMQRDGRFGKMLI